MSLFLFSFCAFKYNFTNVKDGFFIFYFVNVKLLIC